MKLANPSIVIGLGGTGQWVLTYLKKNLIDTYGKVPPTVKLLAFDTTAMYSEEGASNGVDNLPQVDSVQLDAWEYIQLGGNIRGVFEDIKNEGKYQHISSWLQAEEYLSSFDDDAYDISKGAGQRRPFGRMAVFYDLGTGSPKITGKLIQAINDVMTANQRQQPIGFYIIASVAGGTGSGMFIDMAHIARKMAEAANVASAIRGFIVLQNTFAPFDKVYNIEPNAFAAMRELNRFMLAFDHDYPIYYSDAQREPRSLYNSIYKSKLFDSCHLIDAVRPNLTLRNVPPIRGVFPAVAECMTAFLDPETRSTFFQFYKNIGNEIAKAQAETGKAVYSSVGTYTYILPVEDMIDRNTYKAAIELLRDHLLKIEQDPVDKTLRVSSTGNTETNQPPREEAKSFLQAEKSRMGLQNLHFNQQVAQFLESGRMKEQDSIAYVADAGTEMLNWVLPSVRDDVILSDVKRNIQAIFETSFVAEVPNSKVYRDGTPEAAGRIKTKIKQMRENMLGREDASGNRTQGDLQKGLPEFQKRNTTRFRKLLTEKVEDILNGTTDDPMRGKVGKLPYARDFAGWLVQAFDEFIVFMRAVVEERANRGELSLAREYVLTTKQMMDETRNLTGLLDRIKGTAVNTQNQYIAAENYLLELERQEVLYQSVLSTAEALKAVASEFKAQCDRWLDVLALGEAIGRKEQYREAGVYTKLLSLQEELRQKREEQAQVQVYKYLSGPGSAANPEDDYKYEDELYRRLISGEWPDILSRFSWEFEEMGDGLYLHFKYGDDNRVVERDRRNTATETYTRFLLEILHPYFYEMRNETIADRMEYLFTPQLTAKNLLDNSEAMISYNRYEQPFSEKRKYVCVNRGIQVRYFDELAKALRQTAPNYRDNRVIGLTNKHRCTVISLDDLLLIDALAPYQSAQSTYLHETDRDLLHIFPAEINAVNLEQKLSQAPLFKEDHIFPPRLVSLLENNDMVQKFIFSYVYGLIQKLEDSEKGTEQYALCLDQTSRIDRTSVIHLTQPGIDASILDAMETFVYLRIHPETGERVIFDTRPGSIAYVEPARIDAAIRMYEESLVNGYEEMVAKSTDKIKKGFGFVNAQHENVFLITLRQFVAENHSLFQRESEVLQNRFIDLVSKCEELFCSPTTSQLIDDVLPFIIAKYKENRENDGVNSLAKNIESLLAQEVFPVDRAEDKSILRDLNSIAEIVLWNKLQTLQRAVADVDNHPLNSMAQKFLRQAGFEVSFVASGIYKCHPDTPTMQHLLPNPVYARIYIHRDLNSSAILKVRDEIKRVSRECSVAFVVTDQRPTDQGWAQIGTLRMGRNSFNILPIEQTMISKGLTMGIEGELLHQEIEKRIGSGYDPYDVRDPVAGAFSFFGHDALIDDILSRIRKGHPVGIFGLRKLGKSSLLQALSNRASFPTANVNLQTFVNAPLNHIYKRVLRYWQRLARIRYDVVWNPPSLSTEDAAGVFTSATLDLLDLIDSENGYARLGLFLDEVELIVPQPDGSGPNLKQYLKLMRTVRGLVDEDGRLSLIVASLNPSINRINAWDGEQNPAFSLLQEIMLPPLTQSDCIQMIRNIGRQVGLVYDTASVESIAELSGGHPFLARQLCSLLYQLRERRSGQITEAAIPAAVEQFIYDEQKVTHLDAGIWQDAGNISLWGKTQADVNQTILLELAEANDPLSKNDLLNGENVASRHTALINLERFHFIYQLEPGYYALRYGLLRIWLRRRKLGLEGS